MPISTEEVRSFIADAKKSREMWLTWADRSWNELKKRQKNHRLWSVTPNTVKRRARYPAWYSIFKIRQSLVLSRAGIPIGRDTTQDGNDSVGATAAIILERLAINLARSFDFLDVMECCRDDFLATCFSQSRAYYERDEVKEKVKEYITPQKDPVTGEVVFVDGAGKIVESDDIGQDDEGYFLSYDKVVDVENERICLEPLLYRQVYIDPDIRRWNRCKRLAFEEFYSPREFKKIFGQKAYNDISLQMVKLGEDEAKSKLQSIRVYEYWDEYEKEVLWLAEFGTEFITPNADYQPDSEESMIDGVSLNGLYNLEKFFPCPPPLMMNQPTDEFWPVPEFYQLVEIFDDIHTIFSRMLALTKSIRARVLFDNNVEGLQASLNEAAEGDAFGVPNLAQSLQSAGGDLTSVVQYIPVAPLIEGLNQLYIALEQRLNTVYRLTGTSDMLQGLAQDQTQRTFGERQMTEKYALNQLEQPQRKMAEFVRDNYQLLCEMALQNFKQASLDQYIIPATLQPEHKERYQAALGLLKDNQKRFRIELETDSTIALNEQYDKQMRIELVNTLTQAIEKTADIATSRPELITVELHALKFLIQGFRQGKLFQSEISAAIDAVIQKAQEPQPPAFNKDEADNQIAQQELALKAQEIQAVNELKQYEITVNAQLEGAKMAQEDRLTQLSEQLEVYKVQNEAAKSQADTQIAYQKLSSDVALAQQELSVKHDALMIELQKVTDKKEYEQLKLAMEAHVKNAELQLAEVSQQLESFKVQSDEKEKWATEARLQAEHELEKLQAHVEMVSRARESQTVQPAPINIHMPQAPITKKKVKVKRDAEGNLDSFETETEQQGG